MARYKLTVEKDDALQILKDASGHADYQRSLEGGRLKWTPVIGPLATVDLLLI